MAFCVTITSKEFKDTAKRLDISEGQLEQIVHEYMNTPETENQFPSDEYIIQKVSGTSEMNPTKDQITVWNSRYAVPQRFTDATSLALAKKAALQFFDKSSIGVKTTQDGSYIMSVAKPGGTEAQLAEKEMQSIKERAIKDGTFMLAPNGKPTNLTERQWLQVRTKAFKKWFGDWEKAAVENEAVNAYKESKDRLYLLGKEANLFFKNIKDRNKISSLVNEFFSDIEKAGNDYSMLEMLQDSIQHQLGVTEEEALDLITALQNAQHYIQSGDAKYLGHTDVSKAVDENGEPLVVYHGATFSNDIKIFNPQTSYFTENKVEADKYGDKFRHPLDNSPKSIPVFLNIRNPHIFDAEGREYKNINDGNFVTFDDFLDSHPEYQNESWYWKYQVGEEELDIPKVVMDAYHKVSTSKTVRTYVSENIGKNNDGVIVRNVLDPADGNISKTVPITDYVPNSSNQIKSAESNVGTFKTGKDNIYLQKQPSAQRQRNLDVLKRFYAGAVSNIVNERRALAEQKRKEYGNIVISRSDLDTNGVLQRREAQSLLNGFRAKYDSIADSYLYTLPNGNIKLVIKPLSKEILTRRALSVLDTMSDQDMASEVQRLEQEYGNGEESLYHINPKKLSEIREQIYKKNPIYDEQTVEESLHYLEGLENEQEQNLFVKTAIGWIKNGTAIFPRDAEKVQQIFSAARKLGIDVQGSKSPIDLQLKVFEKKGNEYVAGTSIVPDQYSELSYNRTVVKEDGTRIDIYDVENTGRGQRAVTDILAKASPKINGEPAASPWCLSTFNYNKETGVATPTASAEHFWNHYNAGKRQIAFVNGKPVAFNSSSRAVEESWWDFNDKIPYDDIKNIDLTAPQKLYSNLRDRVAHEAPQVIKSGIYTYTIFGGTDISCVDTDLGIENDDAFVRTTYNGTQKSVFVSCIDLALPISESTRFDTISGFPLYINNEESGSINVFLNSFSLYAYSARVSYDGHSYLMKKYRKIVDPLIAQFQIDIKNLIKEIPNNVDINNLEHVAIIRRVTEEALKKRERLQVDIENLSEEFKKAEEEAQKKYPTFSVKTSSLEAPTQTETLARELTNAANSHIEDEILSDSWAPLRTAPTNPVEHEYLSAEDADYAIERGEKEAKKLRRLSGKKYSIDTILKALNFFKEKSYADAYNKRVVKPLNEALASKLHDLLRSWDFEVVFDSLTEVFGEDVLGALDVLEKVVYLSNNGDRNQITDAEEFSHAFIKLMGATYRKPQTRKKHPENKLYSELRDLIVETDLYKQTYDQYSTDPNYLYKNGEVNKAKIAEEALGKALAVALNERYEAKDAAEKSFLEKVEQWFQKILTWFKSTVNKNGRLEKELNNIADSILNGTYEGKYLPKIPANQNLVTWESTLEADAREGGHGADIIELFGRHGGIITGSLSYRAQGTVYRSEQDTLHDLDFAFDMSNTLFAAHPELRNNISIRGLDNDELVRMVQEDETIQSLSNIPNIHFLQAFPVTKFDGTSQIVVTFMRTESQELANRFKELHGSYKDRLANFTEEERSQIYLIDCFLEHSPIDSSVQSFAMNGGEGEFNVANYKESFKAKLKMGRAKDLIDYRLWKPNRRNIRSADTVRGEQDITEEIAWQKAPEKTVQNQERQNVFVSSAEFFSGAAPGSDSVWAQEARDLGIKVTEYTRDEWNKLSQEQKTKYGLEYESIARDLARPVIPIGGRGDVEVRRDMMQADSADAIFAIGNVVSPGERGAKYINRANHEVVDGGTGYAVQRGIQRGIPVYVFDQNNNQWKVWDANTQSFVETQEPKLTPHAATIGTRGINENGRLAISRILNNTLSESQQQEATAQEPAEDTIEGNEQSEKPRTTTQQLNALLDSELSASDIANEAEKAVNWLSSAITYYMEHPEEAISRLISNVEESAKAELIDEIKRMTRKQFVELVGIDSLINVYKEDVLTMGESAESQEIWGNINDNQYDVIDLIKENLTGLIQYRASLFAKNEGFGIAFSDDASGINRVVDVNDVNPDNPDENKIKDDDGEHTGNQQDHWQIINNTLDIMYNASAKVKQALSECYLLDKDGNRVKDYLGRDEQISQLDATRSIFTWTQGSVSLQDMINKLEAQLENNPWVSQILDRLKNKDGNETDFQSQFFKVFDKHFQTYSIILKNEDGKLYSKLVNVSPALDDAFNAITTLYKISRHPMFVSTGRVNKNSLARLTSAKETLDTYEELTAENSADLVSTMSEILSLMGLPMDEMTITRGLAGDNLSTIKDALGHIVDALTAEQNNEKYNPFKFEEKNSIRKYTKQLFKPFTALMDEVGVSSFYQDGNMYQSYVNPSYTTKLFQKFHLPEAEFRQFLKDEFATSEWFVTDTSLSADDLMNPEVWKLPWLQEIVRMTEKERAEAFVHKVQLLYNNGKQNKSYMRNMSAEEYTISVLTEFFSDKDIKKSTVFANYRFPIMSNKKASEFVRMVRFTGDSYMDSILDRTMLIFNQELSRIQTVETRQKIYGENHPERIKNFDDNGNHFLFLDYLDSYLHGDNKNTELGKLLRAKLDGKTINEVKLSDLVREQIANNYNAIAEESIEKFKANGVFEYMKNIEGIGNTNTEIENAIRNFAWNDTFAAMNITELLVTDLAFYANAENFQKRFAQVHSPGVRGNKDATDYEGKRVSDGKKLRTVYLRSFDGLKSNIKANLAEVFDKRKRNSSDEQRLGWESLEDFVMTALDKVDVTDGQAFMSITGRRKLGFIFGDWSEAAEEIYNKIRANEANLSDLQTAFQPLKPFVYSRLNKPANAGANTPIKTLNVPIQNKNSVYLLVMAEALLEGEKTSQPNLLKALMDFMEFTHKKNPLSGIDIIQFDSAVKSGNQGVIDLNDFLYDADGYNKAYDALVENVYPKKGALLYNSTFVHEIPVEDFAQQQEVPEHFRDHEHIWGSQIRAIIPSDLPSEFNGAPVTFSTIVKGEMKELTGEEFREEWDETTYKIIRNGINQLAEELGIGKEVPRAERNRKISAILQKEILSSPRYGIDLFLSCAVDENGEFRIPLGDPIQAKRIEQLLNSIIKNRVNKQEIAGGPLVLATNWGSSRRLHIKFKDKVTGGTLIGYEEYLAQGHTEQEYVEYIKEHQGGIEYFECLAPAWTESLYRDFTDEKGVIDVEALEMLHPDLLKLFGYRIPTEDKYSAAPYKIVGFLPKEAGDAFMAPWEAILFTGEDFDVDKKNTQRKKMDIKKKKTSFGDLVKSLSKVKELDSLELTKEEREEALNSHRNLYKYKADREKDRFDRAEEKLINKYNSKVEALDNKYTEGSEELEKAQSSLDTWYDTEHKKLEDRYKKALEELEKEEKDTEGEALEGERQRKVQDYVREFIESPYKFKNSSRYSNANERAIFRALKEAYIRESFEVVLPDAESNDGLKNHIFDMEWSVMTHEAITDQIVNPGGFEEQKRVGYKAAAYKTGKYSMDELNGMSIKELKAAYYTPKNIMNFNTQAQFYKQNAIAGQVLGSFAIQKVAHAMLENRHYGVAVATPFTIMGKTYSDVVEIDKTYNEGGVERIGKTLGSLVSASADAVKDPILNLMNINTTTLKVLCAAIRTGMEFENIAMLLASNTITDVLNTYTARNLSEYVSFDDIIQERLTVLEQNSGIDERSKLQQEGLEYEEILADMLGYDPKIEYKILLAYQRLSNIAKAMEPLTTLTRFNSIVSAVGPQQVDNLMMEHKVENAEESTVMKLVDGKWTEVPATTLFDDIPSLREYYTAYSMADELFESLDIPTASEQFAGVLANLPGKLKEDVYKDRKRITSLAEFFLSYALVENKVVNTGNLDYYINKFPESYLSKNFKDKYPDNPFVQAIQIDTRKTSDGKERLILKIDTVGMEQEEKDKLTAGWLQFYKKEPRYAMALFYYNFFTAGVGFSPKSFMGLMPIQVKEAIPGYIQTYRGLPAMPSEIIIDLWVRNNVSDSKLVPYVNKDTFSKFAVEDGVLEVQEDEYYNMVGKPYFKASEGGKTKVYRQIKGEIDKTNLTIKYEEVSILGDDGRYMEFSDTPMTNTEVVKEAPIDSGVQDSEITDIELDSSTATKHSERKLANDVYTTIKGETIGFTDNTAVELTFEKQIDKKTEELGLIEDKDKFNKELEEKC